MKKLANILDEIKNVQRPKNLTTEFQVYGVYLAESLDDRKHYSLYIKLAKNTPRNLLEEALTFCKEFRSARSKGKVFMWKLKKLKELSNENKASDPLNS